METTSSLKPSSRPIVLLGAARSGTKLVRDLIGSSRVVAATPYDLNYVWRYGNESFPDDALPSRLMTTETAGFIRSQIKRAAGLGDVDSRAFIEKTVSNALRAPFVSKAMPDARFVYLVRDGRDVIESVMRCWREPPRMGYLWGKIASYPWRYCAPYAAKRLIATAARVVSRSASNKCWGPRYLGIDRDLRQKPLAYVCARQWQACVESYERDRRLLPADSVYEMRYEDLVARPAQTAFDLANWLSLPDADELARLAAQSVTSDRVGRWSELPQEDQQIAMDLISPTLHRWGYVESPACNAA